MNFDVEVKADELEKYVERMVQGEMEKVSKDILTNIADYTLRQMRLNHIEAEFQPGEEMSFVKTENGNEVIVSMVGPQAWYSEFGTGTRGRQRPHPLKDSFALNPYNSGKTIRRATKKVAEKPEAAREGITVGTLYWTYKAPNGEVYYTKGIPSQRQVYTSGKAAKKKLPEIVERNMKRVFK